MDNSKDYIKDISEIRSMMERSTKFLSLSGWAGIMAGIYALAGAYTAYTMFNFNPSEIIDTSYLADGSASWPAGLILIAGAMIVLTIATAIFLSQKRANKKNEKLWNATSRRLVINMSVPLLAGGLFCLILLFKGLIGLIAPLTLIFYGLSLYIASKYAYDDLKILGLVNICLGLLGTYLISYGLLLWALGFGAGHIVYGLYVHYKYER